MSRWALTIANEQVRARAVSWVLKAPPGMVVEFKEPRRSLDQNALMWSRLGELSQRLPWHGQKLTPEDWKCLATASLRKCRFVPGMDPGTVVPLGLSTSSMTKAEMADLLTLLEAFAAEHGITFKDQEEA